MLFKNCTAQLYDRSLVQWCFICKQIPYRIVSAKWSTTLCGGWAKLILYAKNWSVLIITRNLRPGVGEAARRTKRDDYKRHTNFNCNSIDAQSLLGLWPISPVASSEPRVPIHNRLGRFSPPLHPSSHCHRGAVAALPIPIISSLIRVCTRCDANTRPRLGLTGGWGAMMRMLLRILSLKKCEADQCILRFKS